MRIRPKLPSIAIAGRSNVGKSTLFNRLSRTRSAIVCDRPGVTVDRHELVVEDFLSFPVLLVDTAGVGESLDENPFKVQMEGAAKHAIQGADVVLLVVDGRSGLSPEDEDLVGWIRREGLKEKSDIVIAVNKSDCKDCSASDFYGLGFEDVMMISAEHGIGIGELATLLEEKIQAKKLPTEEVLGFDKSILILGRPNVGKSTLVNRLIGEDRHAVSAVAGTTRDPIASDFRHRNMTWRLVDTAGLRRPGRRERGVEWVAGHMVKDVASKADAAVLVIDSSEGVTDMDAALGGMAIDFGLSLVVVFNKWDLMGGDTRLDKLLTLERTRDLKMDFLDWCPQVRISAKTGRGIEDLFPKVEQVTAARQIRVQTSKLNDFFEKSVKEHEHPAVEGNKRAAFYYITQTGVSPPEFVLFTNVQANQIHFSFRRYLVNSLRAEFGFVGTPIKLHFKTKS